MPLDGPSDTKLEEQRNEFEDKATAIVPDNARTASQSMILNSYFEAIQKPDLSAKTLVDATNQFVCDYAKTLGTTPTGMLVRNGNPLALTKDQRQLQELQNMSRDLAISANITPGPVSGETVDPPKMKMEDRGPTFSPADPGGMQWSR